MRKRILIVDDDVAVGESLKVALEGSGYVAKLATDGLEGATLLEREKYDLLLLDLNLPTLSGWDILDLVTVQLPALPTVILTGLADQCEPGALAGADALVEKPPDVYFLLQLIERLLGEPAQDRLRRRTAQPGSALRASGAQRTLLRVPPLPSRPWVPPASPKNPLPKCV